MLTAGAGPAVRNLDTTGRVVVSGDGAHGVLTVVRRAEGLSGRSGDGNRIERILLNGREAVLVVRQDFDVLRAAINRLAAATESGASDVLSAKPFREAVMWRQVLEEIGGHAEPVCCPVPEQRMRRPRPEAD